MTDVTGTFYGYWGKTGPDDSYHLLPYHCLDVAAVLTAMIEKDDRIKLRLTGISGLDVDALLPWLTFFAALHDIGKYSLGFQEKSPEVMALLGKPLTGVCCGDHHTTLGMWFWQNKLARTLTQGQLSLKPRQVRCLAPLAEAAFGHHGQPASLECGRRPFSGSEADVLCLVNIFTGLFLSNAVPPPEEESAWRKLSWLFAGLLVAADWIGSASRWFPLRNDVVALETYWSLACKKAGIAVEESGLLHPSPSPLRDFHALVPNIPIHCPPSPLQEHALNHAPTQGPQLHIFEDLTGAGKTEAALLCAHGIMSQGEAGGLFIALPTMATANAMYARLAETHRTLFAKESRPSLMLAHGARRIHEDFLETIALERNQSARKDWSLENSRAECSAWLADNRKKALLAPCGAGTLDQALLAVLPTRHQSLRLLGLTRVVLVADEIHAYDEYTGELLQKLLTFLGALGASAILLTATLPLALRQKLVDAYCVGRGWDFDVLRESAFPLASRVCAEGIREVPIQASRSLEVAVDQIHDPERMFTALLQARAAGACACWVRNTVDDAIEAYQYLLEAGIPESDIILFHARFAMADRLRIEEQVLTLFGKQASPRDRSGKIVIGTQVLEQSLNLDFDLMLSDVAPMDCLIQRAGRCHRFGKTIHRPEGFSKPLLLVLTPPPDDEPAKNWHPRMFPRACWVYPRQAVLWRTARLLQEKGRLALPEDARELMEGAYGRFEAPDVFLDVDMTPEGEARAKAAMAHRNALAFDLGYRLDAAETMWTSDARVPTRLGEDTVRVRLCRMVQGSIHLWAGPDVSPLNCARSEVPINANRLRSVWPDDPEMLAATEAFAHTMPDEGRHCLVLALRPGPDADQWQALGLDHKERPVRINYDRMGLRLVKE
ncbi:CRISPR-associated helicase/endonuclease Cas3 [Desulfonatronum thioautotrophicum]|uniref:CRISPR-associated helicase/endonuclease Cas3 n=1 Tax=Desulfonatronum thioautotrophicum TaxID=617001 RepID=UPI00069930C6|nr:CRISPR-associated helicase/endonuclease Cas3 [Desulfonatronum thioautotrophicum]